MATADELLATLANTEAEDKVLLIDNDLRTIIIPASVTNLGTESEKDVHRLHFRMPRYLGDVDLSELNIRINYMNANTVGDIYVVTDKKILTSTITFSWLVGANALAYKGNVNFIVCLKKSDTEGNVLKEFNTTVATLPVLEGLEVDTAPLETELHDVLEQLLSLTEAKVAEVEAAGVEQITKVQAKSVEEQENIVEKGKEVLATIPEDYQTTIKLANEGVRSKADAIVCSAEGEMIVVSDSSDDHVRGLKLFGKSTQDTTTGKNLLPYPYSYDSKSTNGVDITVNTDGSILINGTATAGISFHLATTFTLPAGEYVLSGCPSGGGLEKYRIYFSDNVTKTVADYGSKSTFTLTEAFTGQVVIQIFTGVVLNNLVFYPMIRHASIVDDTYEPYTGGKPAPNPDYPQEIVSIENPTVNVFGKNLLDVPESLVFTQYMSMDIQLPAGEYVVSCDGFDGEYSYGPSIKFPKNNAWVHFKEGVLSKTLKLTKPETMLHFYADGSTYNGSAGKTATINGLMLSIIGGDYETYIAPQSITLTCTLPGIPVTSGGNYTDENGQQWVCDEIDFERGVYVQRVGTKELNGSEGWALYSADGIRQFYMHDMSDIAYEINNVGVMCRYYAAIPLADRKDNYNCIYSTSNGVCINTLECESVAEWKDLLSSRPIEIRYILATPIETPLTADELAAFSALTTNNPNTTVLNDSGVHMKLRYNADTETWIKNLIDERIATALANL